MLDTTDPVSPTLLATYPLQARELLFRAGRLYAQGEDRLLILDVVNPSAPALLGSYGTSPGLGLVSGVQREGQRLYASSERGVQILDVSQPLTPTLQGFVPFTKTSKLLVQNNLLYAVDQTALRVIDVSDPISPTERLDRCGAGCAARRRPGLPDRRRRAADLQHRQPR